MNEYGAMARYSFHLEKNNRRICIEEGSAPEEKATPKLPGRIPRVARLLALARKFQSMIDDGVVESMAEIARLGNVTRARMSQIMDLLLLAPDIQEELLFLPPSTRGRDVITVRELSYVCQTLVWEEQRKRWMEIKETF